jgi:hypothetical protein
MSHPVRRQLLTAAVAASCVAFVAAPTAGAKSKLSRTDKAQNTAIKKANKTATTAGKTARNAAKSATKGITDAKTAAGKAAAAQGTANGILSQVPAVLDGLTKLAAGLTAAGDGLAKIGNALAAQEYGVVKIQLGTTDAPGAILTSSDIPDDSNSAVVSGTLVTSVPAGATNVPIRLLAGVRSGETDGTGAANPVASAGIVTMSVESPLYPVGVGGGNGAPVGTSVPITSKANAAAEGAPVYPIPLKAPRVDATPNPFSFPDADAIDLTDAATLQDFGGGVGPFTISNPSGDAIPITITVTVRFNDLTASATDVTA